MSDTWQLLQRIESLEGRILQLELQLSIALIQIAESDKGSLSPEGPESSGVAGVRENAFSDGSTALDEPDDEDWLRRLAGLELPPEITDANRTHFGEPDESDSDPALD